MAADRETIFALASPSGRGGVAVIRLSGPLVRLCCEEFFPKGRGICETPRTMHYQGFVHPKTSQVVDDLLLCFFAGPASFTGEDVLELYPHNGPYILETISRCLLDFGLRYAEPGEFTRRAFLNQKMDLCSAEGVRLLTESVSEQQWRAARQLSSSRLSHHIDSLRGLLIEAMAYLEARIDFPEEGDVAGVDLFQVTQRVDRVEQAVGRLLSSFTQGEVASQGLRVALVGPPNAGKSTLLNLLLGRERSIVTEVAGTTRDYIKEDCLLEGRLLQLIDTAGLRESEELVERLGMERSLEQATQAHAVISLCPPGGEPVTGFDKPLLVLHTKADLDSFVPPSEGLCVSAHTGQGIDELKAWLIQQVDHHVGPAQNEEELFITATRHKFALTQALEALQRFREASDWGAGDEILAYEVKSAGLALDGLLGKIDQEDLLDKIFSDFCVGK